MIGRYIIDSDGQAWLLPFDGSDPFQIDRDPVFEVATAASTATEEP